MSFLSKVVKGLGKAVKTVAPIASFAIPGIGTLGGLAATAGSSLLSNAQDRSLARSQNDATAQFNALQIAENRRAQTEAYIRSDNEHARDRAEFISDTENQFVRLRQAAEKGGINPLTALGQQSVQWGGGQGAATIGPAQLQAQSAFAPPPARGLLSDLAAEFTSNDAADRAEQQARTEFLKVQTDQIRGNSGVHVTRHGPTTKTLAPVQEDSVTTGSGFVRPVARPTPETSKRVPIYAPDGSRMSMMKTTADRLGLKPFDALTAGEFAEVAGELVGEGLNTVLLDKVAETQGYQFFGEKGAAEKKPQSPNRKGRNKGRPTN